MYRGLHPFLKVNYLVGSCNSSLLCALSSPAIASFDVLPTDLLLLLCFYCYYNLANIHVYHELRRNTQV